MTKIRIPATDDERFVAAERFYRKDIRSWAFSKSPSTPFAEAEDLVTEAYLVLWKIVKGYNPNKGAFSALFWQSVNNRLKDIYRDSYWDNRKANLWTQPIFEIQEFVDNGVMIQEKALAYEIESRMSCRSAEDEFLDKVHVQESFDSLPRSEQLKIVA